ncbi:hypothetical protein K3495_g3270 [Podosphaera aphanis]|nr:hypothetical protein K3495_g3270 [Podosphaera aphanis]
MAEATEDTTKARIMKHMNTDHAESLVLYLRHYSKLSPQTAHGAMIYEISVSSMNLRTPDSRTHTILFEPPMNSLADVRERMIEMDRTVRSALGISNIRLTRYLPPASPLHVSVFGVCLFTFVTFGMVRRGDVIVPGTFYHDHVLPWFPGGPEMFIWIAQKIALPTVAIHIAEAWYLDRTRLRKYGVERGTRLWWCWIVSCLIEGFGTFQRIDAELQRIRTKTEKSKH